MSGIPVPTHNHCVSLNEKLNDNQTFNILKQFSASLDVLEYDLNCALVARDFSTLATEEHIKLDTYLVFANSTLFWMFLKLQGYDLSKHYILDDLSKAKELLAREKEINNFNTAPRLDIAASKRFISAGLRTRFVDMDGVMVTEEQYNRSLLESGKAS